MTEDATATAAELLARAAEDYRAAHALIAACDCGATQAARPGDPDQHTTGCAGLAAIGH